MLSSTITKEKILSLAMFMLLPILACAQLSVNGEFRPRTELRDGYRILNTSQSDPAFFTSQRTRLILHYTTDAYTFKLSAQDVRTWGEVSQLGDTPNVNIHEAWAQLNLSEMTQLQLGRQELIYDDQRLLGSVNWAQQARSHDALRFKYRNGDTDFSLDIGAAYNQAGQNLQGNNYPLNNYKVLSYLWLNKDFGDVDLSALVLTDGFQSGADEVNYRYTYGTHVNYKASDELDFSGTFYLQSGDDATRTDISAFMAAAGATYKLEDVTLSGGIDYLSGGEAGDSNPAQGAFSTLYATNHKFYGNMDYFINVPVDALSGGLQDIYLKAVFTTSEDANVSVAYHNFASANALADPANAGETLDKALASEIDAAFTYKIEKDVTFKIGYSVLFSSSTLETVQNRQADGLQQWAWAMLVITPNF
ncbi:MAG: hypothetical protein FH748_07720 [Balneolaceae bacterium]|nr:hypothetical protein [Balneolaceae bacterium]